MRLLGAMSETDSIPTLATLQRAAHEFLKNHQWAAAREILLEASQHYPTSADVFSDLAAAERSLGQLDQAIAHYQRSLELDPKLAFVHNNLGNALTDKGQLRDAIDCFHRALVLQPRYPAALNNLAKVLLRENRLDEARRSLERLFALSRDFLPAFETLAILCERQGNVQEALKHYISLASHYLKDSDAEHSLWAMDACRRLGHRSAGLEANRCAAFLQLGRFEEARDAGIAALRLDPNHANAHVNLGAAYVALRDFRSALTLQKRATELAPTLAEAFINLGNTLIECDDPQNALIAQNRALELDPNNPRAMCGLAVGYQGLGRRMEASELYRRALTLAPQYAEAHHRYASLLLSEGQLQDGFKEFEWRRSEPAYRKWADRYPGPMWSGQDVNGKTVVLYSAQTLGDALQFVRYAAAFKQRGARVIIDCKKPLHRLLAGQPYVDAVGDSDESGGLAHDFYAPLCSLPHIFGTALNTIPREIPYIRPITGAEAPAAIAGAAGLKIGLLWAGHAARRGDRQRSMGVEQFEPLFDIPGVTWFSLQVGRPREELGRQPTPIVDVGAGFSDFADTAAAISRLDLVLSVDTAIAHLCGAMGKSVWVLLAQQPDWRWMFDRESSPWYPNVRLFRQQQVSAWEPVVSRLKQQLLQSIASMPGRSAPVGPPASNRPPAPAVLAGQAHPSTPPSYAPPPPSYSAPPTYPPRPSYPPPPSYSPPSVPSATAVGEPPPSPAHHAGPPHPSSAPPASAFPSSPMGTPVAGANAPAPHPGSQAPVPVRTSPPELSPAASMPQPTTSYVPPSASPAPLSRPSPYPPPGAASRPAPYPPPNTSRPSSTPGSSRSADASNSSANTGAVQSSNVDGSRNPGGTPSLGNG